MDRGSLNAHAGAENGGEIGGGDGASTRGHGGGVRAARRRRRGEEEEKRAAGFRSNGAERPCGVCACWPSDANRTVERGRGGLRGREGAGGPNGPACGGIGAGQGGFGPRGLVDF